MSLQLLYLYSYSLMILGAGILPISRVNRQLYFLLGKDVNTNKWCDFGGKSEIGETSLKTAIREGYEETSGFLGTQKEMEFNIKSNLLPKFKTNNGRHTVYLYNTSFNEYFPDNYNNNYEFIKKNFNNLLNKNGYFEISEIKWFDINEIKSNKKIRPYFKEIVPLLEKNYDNLLDKIN